MRIFDPHAHMISRTTDCYDRMAQAGIERVVEPAFWIGEPRKHLGTFLDYFDHISNFEAERAARHGIDHYCLIAVNPREANNLKLAERVIEHIPAYLKRPRVVGIGEIGFDDITEAEETVIRAQLEIAREHDLPVMIHTPHKEKRRGTERTIAILRDMDYDFSKVLIDHNTEEAIGIAHATGAWCGHTVYPVTKLSPERAANIFEDHGTERMMVNSSCDWGPSDPLSVPKTVLELKRRGMDRASIERLVWRNPHTFFGLSGKLPDPDA